MKKLTLISALASSLAISFTLSACSVTSAGVKPGDERNFSRSLNDVSVERVIESRLKRADGFDLSKVDVEVAEGIVVLSGSAPTAEDRIEAERIAWSAPHIDQIGNEIMVGTAAQGFIAGTKNNVLGSSVRTRLIADKSVKSRNVNIEARNGIVYLLGVARSAEELERITYLASTTKGAREVVSYMKVHNGDNLPQTQNYAAVPNSFSQAPLPFNPPPNASLPQASLPNVQAPAQRELPSFLTQAPQGPNLSVPNISGSVTQPIDPLAPYYRDPRTGERIELDPNTGTIPFQPSALSGGALSSGVLGSEAKITPLLEAPSAFPSDDELGRFRTGVAGETVSVIESAPYYIDPDTGDHIPVNFTR